MTRTLMLLALWILACGTGSRSAVLYQPTAGEGSGQDYETEPDTLDLPGSDTELEPEQDTQNMSLSGPDTQSDPDTEAGPDTSSAPCIAQCAGVECGPDPVCGFNCGECQPLRECVENKCSGIQECGTAFTVEPQCVIGPPDPQIGPDDLSWVLWCQDGLPHGLNCSPPFFCGFDPKKGTNGCITDPPCVPFCGPITDWENWGADGTPMTRMMECGNDGCYGVCGVCPVGTFCGGELCVEYE